MDGNRPQLRVSQGRRTWSTKKLDTVRKTLFPPPPCFSIKKKKKNTTITMVDSVASVSASAAHHTASARPLKC